MPAGLDFKKYKCRFSSPVVNPLLWMSFQVICILICFINFSSRGQCYIVTARELVEKNRQISIKSLHAGNISIKFIFHRLYFVKSKYIKYLAEVSDDLCLLYSIYHMLSANQQCTVSIATVGKRGTYYIILKKSNGQTPGHLAGVGGWGGNWAQSTLNKCRCYHPALAYKWDCLKPFKPCIVHLIEFWQNTKQVKSI